MDERACPYVAAKAMHLYVPSRGGEVCHGCGRKRET